VAGSIKKVKGNRSEEIWYTNRRQRYYNGLPRGEKTSGPEAGGFRGDFRGKQQKEEKKKPGHGDIQVGGGVVWYF